MQTLLDVWEGSLDIDEEIIGSGGIIGLIIRLNHMSGGHHKDTNFNAQWLQAVNFLRAPYFVYSPWVDGKANYNWLMGNLPQNDVSLISADIEVRYPEYSPEVYADQVQIFTDLVKAQCHMVIYTGQWFLPTLAHWPTNVEYWWARYPDRFYPTPSEAWSYEKLEVETEKYGWYPDPQKKSPGAVEIWQCSGDRLKLPGCQGRAVDVNLINKTPEETIIWWGADTIPQPPISKLDILWREAYDHPPAGWNLTP
jgi:GH25 family lysozyme M1 (1,4-beta-N-acetylmuramidase)